MKFSQRLLPRIALPMLGCLLLLTLTAVLVMWAYHDTLQRHEMEQRAKRVVAALESASHRFASGTELLSFTLSFGAQTASLAEIALVDATETIVVTPRDAWRGRQINQIELLRNKRNSDAWMMHEFHRVYLLPIQLNDDDLSAIHGRELAALIVIDGTDLGVVAREVVAWVLWVTILGSLVFFGICLKLLQRHVAGPVAKIYSALMEARGSGRHPKMPYLYPDEIGEIGRELTELFKKISDANDDMLVMNRALEDSSSEVYVVQASTRRFVRANRAARENVGYTAQELLGMPIGIIAPDNDDPEILRTLMRQIKEKGEIWNTYEHVRRDGSTYPFEYKAIPVKSARGNLFIVLGQDVSARIAQEAALKHSEERLQLALKGSNDGLFDINVQAGTIFISELIQSWIDAPSQYITRKKLLSYIAPEHTEELLASLDAAFNENKDFNAEFQLAGRGGRWLQVRGHVQFDEGVAARLTGFASDVTRRKVAENLLQTTVSRLSAVLDTIADGVLILDEAGRVRGFNPAALNMFGMDKDQMSGYLLSDCLSIIDGEDGFGAPDWQEISDGQLRECVGLKRDCSQFAAEIAAMRMDAVADEHYTVLVRDISDRKEHEEELRQAMEDAQAATQAKGEFLATMSHEIRTPMNGVLGMTQLLLDMNLNSDQRETAEIIFSSGEALLTLINDILDFSKIEAGRLELEQMPFDMRAAIKEVMDLLATTARRKALDLYVDYDADLPFAFDGDVGRIRQILLNLIGNAVKFTASGHVLVSVGADEAEDGDTVLRVRVRDTGPGIELSAQETLFDSFTQADASTTRRYGGTGLGLAICRQLVELMGGELGVESTAGEGAEFWFTLHLARSKHAPEIAPFNFERLAGLRMLAVDDNGVGLRIIEGMGRSLGLDVQGTQDPLAVIDLMVDAHEAGQPFDVVALDYNMPRMDGLTLATNIADDARFADTRLVMLTSSELRRPGGLHGYALKPLMRDGLGRMLLKACFGAADNEPAVLLDEVGPVGDNVRVLLAEDNPVNQRVAVRMLERLGCRVDVAANGREAVQMWEQFPYAMIFMDCQMPELDGLAATEEIRTREAREDRARTPIVAMTANAMRQDEENCLAAGMDDYASKPVKLDLLQELIVRWSAVTSSADTVRH